MSIKEIKHGNLTWLNITKTTDETITYLKDHYRFHHLDLEDILSESQTPKLDTYDNYLFLVTHFPTWKASGNKIAFHEIDFFLGDNYLITVQQDKDKELKDLFYRLLNNRNIRSSWMGNSSGFLLYKLLESLFMQSRSLLNNIGKHISTIENEIFSGEQDSRVIRELALDRRNVLNFRRIVDPQRYIISTLSHTRKTFLDESLSVYFDNVRDYLDKLWVIVDSYKETIDGLHLTVESIINQRTNKVISALTVISVSLLPLTLLSGIYGMNIDALPHAHEPVWVWCIFGGLATFIVLLILLAKRRKWL